MIDEYTWHFHEKSYHIGCFEGQNKQMYLMIPRWEKMLNPCIVIADANVLSNAERQNLGSGLFLLFFLPSFLFFKKSEKNLKSEN